MADVLTKKKRSAVMAAVRSRGNKQTELVLAKLLRANRITGWRRHPSLPGKPDFVFQRQRLAVFVDGCFWHGCPDHCRMPSSNQAYWAPKLAKNKARDKAVTTAMRKRGWRVLRIWEHDLRCMARCLRRIRGALSAPSVMHTTPVPTSGWHPF